MNSESFMSTIVFRISRACVGYFLRVWLRMSRTGMENIPETGGCIIVANHSSFLDPPAVGCSANKRIVHFMARDTLFKPGFRNWFFTQVQCVPLDRERGDISALRRGLGVLKQGQVLGLFPEGTRSPDGTLQEPKAGIGFLIAKGNVPVVPAYVSGTFRAYPRGARFVRPTKVRVVFGEPILPEELASFGRGRDAYMAVAGLVMERIADLRENLHGDVAIT